VSSPTVPTLTQLLEAGPPDPAARWPEVPPTPVDPGPPFAACRAAGTGHPLWTQPVAPGSDAGALWLGHRSRFGQTGLWPVLVDDAFWEAVELEPFGATPSFAGTKALLRQLVAVHTEPDGAEGPASDADLVVRGPVPEAVVDDRRPEQVINSSEEHTTLLLVPARAGWVVPELLGWDGAVNHLVHGREHTAVLGRWAGLFGAELFGLTRDVLQLLITRPPADERGRLQAAAEIYAYCPDTVDQGVETLEALTQMSGGRAWWLWWD
jgi:hypothetical protein